MKEMKFLPASNTDTDLFDSTLDSRYTGYSVGEIEAGTTRLDATSQREEGTGVPNGGGHEFDIVDTGLERPGRRDSEWERRDIRAEAL